MRLWGLAQHSHPVPPPASRPPGAAQVITHGLNAAALRLLRALRTLQLADASVAAPPAAKRYFCSMKEVRFGGIQHRIRGISRQALHLQHDGCAAVGSLQTNPWENH